MKKLIPLLIVLLFAGCKKDKDIADLLTRSWQLTKSTRKTNTGDSVPLNISSCDDNKIWTFKNDGNFSTEPSPECVSNSFAEVYNGSWTLTGDKALKLEALGRSGAMYFDTDIIEVTKSKLILRTWITIDGRAGVRRGDGFNDTELIIEFSAR